MSENTKSENAVPVQLTQAQRQVIADIIPDLAPRLKLVESSQRTIQFSRTELKAIARKAKAVERPATGMKRVSLGIVESLISDALDHSEGYGSIPVSKRYYQFKITLLETRPIIWRRIRVKDCSMDRLHEYIQTAMGWTNSHLHDFHINDQGYGDPFLLTEDDEERDYVNSRHQNQRDTAKTIKTVSHPV